MNDLIKIMVVEDNPASQDLYSRYLSSENWSVEVAGSGREARSIAQTNDIEIALIDINLPDEDGFSLSRHLRSTYNIGIIQVTGRGEPDDKVTGLDSGADDYLVKPVNLMVLGARVRALSRRMRTPMTWSQSGHGHRLERPAKLERPAVDEIEPVLKPRQHSTNDGGSQTTHVPLGRCYLDSATGELFENSGQHVALTAAESELLVTLISHPNRVFSQLELAQNMSAGGKTRAVSTVYNRINQLRKKIEKNPDNPLLIRTLYGKGYIYVPDKNQ